MLSSWDDYPVHQIADTIRHVGTSDRNFYDRYYFNLHGSSDELFMVDVTPLTHAFIAVGTGYGMDADWRHGMYQGPLVVQGLDLDQKEVGKVAQYGVVDHVARFEYDGNVGFGLHEHAFIGAFEKCGLRDGASGAE